MEMTPEQNAAHENVARFRNDSRCIHCPHFIREHDETGCLHADQSGPCPCSHGVSTSPLTGPTGAPDV